MPRFFTEQVDDEKAIITGEDAKHIIKALRMTVGGQVVVCDGEQRDYQCEIESITDEVRLRVLSSGASESEPDLCLHLYQAMPKGEKFEFIVQKAVELGVYDITPVLTSRCISRPDKDTMRKKLVRYNKIAAEAAKQSGRGRIPVVRPLLSYQEALKEMAAFQNAIFFYECKGQPLQKIIQQGLTETAILIGSEGGFSEEEAAAAETAGLFTASLGKRILRCETAPIAGISIIMNLSGNM